MSSPSAGSEWPSEPGSSWSSANSGKPVPETSRRCAAQGSVMPSRSRTRHTSTFWMKLSASDKSRALVGILDRCRPHGAVRLAAAQGISRTSSVASGEM